MVFVFFFQVLMSLWFVFGVSGKVAEVSKMLRFLFPQFLGAFVGWLILVYLGLEGLDVFVVRVFVFFFCLGFVFCFLSVLLLDCFWLCSCFVFVLFFLFLFFFYWSISGSGEVAQRATPLGPKPSLFFVFLLLLLFLSLLSILCFF